MTVHVTLDEKGPRLPSDVEYELLRIAQEAMANARKHSGAANLWLRCTVRSPYAEIEVGDDGINQHVPEAGLAGDDDHARAVEEHRRRLAVEEPTPGTRDPGGRPGRVAREWPPSTSSSG